MSTAGCGSDGRFLDHRRVGRLGVPDRGGGGKQRPIPASNCLGPALIMDRDHRRAKTPAVAQIWRKPMDLRLSGQVAIVTGASKGIGLAVTRTLLAEGAKVVAASRKQQRRSSTRSPALSCSTFRSTSWTRTGPAHVVARAVEEFGGLDILVNNAGGPPPGAALPRFGVPHAQRRGLAGHVRVQPVRRRPGLPRRDPAHARARRRRDHQHLIRGRPPAGGHERRLRRGEVGPEPPHRRRSQSSTARRGSGSNTVAPGPVRTAWWTEDGGAADIIAGHQGTDRDDVLEKPGADDDGAGQRPTRRPAGDRRRGRDARVAAIGQHVRVGRTSSTPVSSRSCSRSLAGSRTAARHKVAECWSWRSTRPHRP